MDCFVPDVGGRVSSVAGMAHDSSGQGSLNISDVSKWMIVCRWHLYIDI